MNCKICGEEVNKCVLFLPTRVFIALCPRHLKAYCNSGEDKILPWIENKKKTHGDS